VFAHWFPEDQVVERGNAVDIGSAHPEHGREVIYRLVGNPSPMLAHYPQRIDARSIVVSSWLVSILRYTGFGIEMPRHQTSS